MEIGQTKQLCCKDRLLEVLTITCHHNGGERERGEREGDKEDRKVYNRNKRGGREDVVEEREGERGR